MCLRYSLPFKHRRYRLSLRQHEAGDERRDEGICNKFYVWFKIHMRNFSSSTLARERRISLIKSSGEGKKVLLLELELE